MDARDREAAEGSWYDRFDEETMTLYWDLYWDLDDDDGGNEPEEIAFPAKFEVCGLCEGRGVHVNPSIDAHGISHEEMYDDPNFAEAYFGGAYDVPCYRCKGKRVEPVIDESNLDEAGKANLKCLNEYRRDMASYYAECAAERRMGA